MKLDKFDKFKPSKEPEKLEKYLIAADDPVGSSQLRPIFKRKRSGEILTREQVSAIKKGRKILRKEMKSQGLKRRIDFEVTATNMGLYFDRNRFFWPFFLWLIRDNTVLKVLATTAAITTAVTVSVPVVEYLTELVQEYIERIVQQTITQYQEKEVDRFTINLSDELFNSGFTLSEDFEFTNATTQLVTTPLVGVPCLSIRDIPRDVNDVEGHYPSNSFFSYSFYCRYESTQPEPINYYWNMQITEETEVPLLNPETGEQEGTRLVSDAVWVMIFEDNKMMFYAKLGEDGELESIPSQEINDMGYDMAPMIDFAKDLGQYEIVQHIETSPNNYFDYYRIKPHSFVSEKIVAEGMMQGVTPFNKEVFNPEVPFDPENPNGIHKYTVVIWLEGDDPECTNHLIGGKIGFNFNIMMETEKPEEEAPEGSGTPEAPAEAETPATP